MEGFVVEDVQFHVPKARDMIIAANMGLKKSYFAQKIDVATNGAYFLLDDKKEKVGVFKPVDEEDHEGLISSWSKGDSAIREVAAYILDVPKNGEEDGFCGIPPTTIVRCLRFKDEGESQWTKGSLQKYVPNKPWHHLGHEVFSIKDFQKMTLVQIRYGNMGGHKFNNLWSKEGTLIPIDHGACFPKWFQFRCDWASWKQAHFLYLPEIVEYAKTLDVDNDLEVLRVHNINLGEEAIFVFKVQHVVLQEGVLGGHIPHDIGRFMVNELRSVVQICQDKTNGDEKKFMETIRMQIKGHLDLLRSARLHSPRVMTSKVVQTPIQPESEQTPIPPESEPQPSRKVSRFRAERMARRE